jgi:HK97 family phage prohead protease
MPPGPGGKGYKQDDDGDDVPEPHDDETVAEYMDRCTAAGHDEDDCRDAWEEFRDESDKAPNWDDQGGLVALPASKLVQKTHAAEVQGMEFILSDETPDRMGDVITAGGWMLDNFNKNPIALFNHRADFPVGRWNKLRVDGGALRGHLQMAPAGTSDRIDEIRKLIDAGILRAVSVGFKEIESEPLDPKDKMGWNGKRFLRQELVETSLVSVPANPNALAVAKSLRVSTETLNLVFKPSSARSSTVRRRSATGEVAKPPSSDRRQTMSLSQRIQDQQARITGLRDQLQEHLKKVNDENVSDADLTVTQELNSKIAQNVKGLAALQDAEQQLASEVKRENGGDGMLEIRMPTRHLAPPSARPITIPAKKLEPIDYLWRSLTVMMKQHAIKGARPITDMVRETYGDDEGTAATVGWLTRNPAASAPAMTSVAGWAQELVAIVLGEFFKALIPLAVFPKLSAKGTSFTFGRAGVIYLPMRNITPTVSGSFVGEGAPIPVRQGQFVTQQMVPKKMAVITTFTREIAEHSTPSIEGILRDALLEDTSIALDTVLLDTNPATAIRPAGILNGVAATAATAGGGFNALIGDVKALTNALIVATRGNFRQPVWIMSPALALSASLTPTTGAQALPFREEVSRGFLMGIPIIESTTVPAGMLIIVDAADFAAVTGDDPRFEVSDQAVLHMEDTTPLAIGTPGTPPTVAAPTRSLWQTDTIGLRMIMPMNWTMRRPTSVAYTTAVTWQ